MSDDIDLEIPDFLRRHKGEVLPPWQPSPTAPAAVAEEKWRVLEQQRQQERKRKSQGRVAKMLSVKSDREAVASGKTWDVRTGRWLAKK